MDEYIATLPYTEDGPLNICKGIAYQRDMSKSVPYKDDYFNKYIRYEDNEIGKKINACRLDLIEKHCPYKSVLDVGIGSGQMIKMAKKRKIMLYGYDINPVGVNWLKEHGKFYDISRSLKELTGICFFDSLEHIPNPGAILKKLNYWTYVFMSIPIIKDFNKLREWKHYRPDEHYYYFTQEGLFEYMEAHNCVYIAKSDCEIKAGRDDIYTYIWRRV